VPARAACPLDPLGADIVRLHAQVRFTPFAIFLHRSITHDIRLFGRRWHRGHYPRSIAEVPSGSAINITSEIIDHGHRPRPHRRCCSCLIISRASRRDAHLEILCLGRDGAAPYEGIDLRPSRQMLNPSYSLTKAFVGRKHYFESCSESNAKHEARYSRIQPDCRASSAIADPAATSPINAMNSPLHRITSPDRKSAHPPCCSSTASYQRLLNSSSTTHPTFLPRDLSLPRRSR
jgi:hypothetical protein